MPNVRFLQEEDVNVAYIIIFADYMEHVKRKRTRLKDYDYSSSGVYFITICTKDRKPILSNIVGEGLRALPGSKESLITLQKTELTKIGAQVKSAIEFIDTHSRCNCKA